MQEIASHPSGALCRESNLQSELLSAEQMLPQVPGSNFRFNSTNAALTNPKMTSVRRDVVSARPSSGKASARTSTVATTSKVAFQGSSLRGLILAGPELQSSLAASHCGAARQSHQRANPG